MQVMETSQERCHVRGQRVAGQRPAGGGILIAAAVSRRPHHGVRAMIVPGREVAAERVSRRHQQPPTGLIKASRPAGPRIRRRSNDHNPTAS
jgi:hypothetical protein